MVTAQIERSPDGGVSVFVRLQADDGPVGSGAGDIGPGEEYLGIRFDQWNEHVGRFVDVTEDGSLVPAEP